MGTYRDFWNEIVETIPAISPLLAKKFVNRALRDIYRARKWSFLSAETSIDVPDEVTTGTSAVTQFSRIVTGSVAARAVWDVLGLDIPITSRQFRVGSGAIYRILEYDSAGDVDNFPWNVSSIPGSLYLDRRYGETTDALSEYSIYKCYFSVPTDFLSWTEVKDIQNGFTILGERKPLLTREELDRRDPQRSDGSDPFRLAVYGSDESGNTLYELWPHRRSAKSYVAKYERRGVDFSSNTDTLPSNIPDSLLMAKALVYASQWANRNKGRYEELKGVDWLSDVRTNSLLYEAELQRVKTNDEEASVSNIIQAPTFRPDYPVDSNFLRNHDRPQNW